MTETAATFCNTLVRSLTRYELPDKLSGTAQCSADIALP